METTIVYEEEVDEPIVFRGLNEIDDSTDIGKVLVKDTKGAITTHSFNMYNCFSFALNDLREWHDMESFTCIPECVTDAVKNALRNNDSRFEFIKTDYNNKDKSIDDFSVNPWDNRLTPLWREDDELRHMLETMTNECAEEISDMRGVRRIRSISELNENEYAFAFRLAPDDFHFIRRLSDGRWAEKRGSGGLYIQNEDYALRSKEWFHSTGIGYCGKVVLFARDRRTRMPKYRYIWNGKFRIRARKPKLS